MSNVYIRLPSADAVQHKGQSSPSSNRVNPSNGKGSSDVWVRPDGKFTDGVWSWEDEEHKANLKLWAGRRRYNKQRQEQALLRQAKVAELILEAGGLHNIRQQDIAEKLGVSQPTVSADIKALTERAVLRPRCPVCRQMLPERLLGGQPFS